MQKVKNTRTGQYEIVEKAQCPTHIVLVIRTFWGRLKFSSHSAVKSGDSVLKNVALDRLDQRKTAKPALIRIRHTRQNENKILPIEVADSDSRKLY